MIGLAVVVLMGALVFVLSRQTPDTVSTVSPAPTMPAFTANATSTAIATTTSASAEPTTQAPVTTVATTAAPTSVARAAGPPKAQTVPAAGGSAQPMPSTVPGYRADGPITSMRQRVFEGQPAVVVDGFPAAMSHCAEAFWTVRWRSLNPNITVQGFRTAGGLGGLTPESAADGPIPAATTAGYISGFFCQQPAFAFGTSSDAGNLVDVVIEVQHWVAAA